MRADRLVATLLVLQAKGRVTAAELADELEISIKTARRDLEALAIAGIPVYSQAGRGGGWSLIGGARTDLSGLTAAEARTLFMVAGPSSTATPEAKAALRKLVQALPETFRAEAEAAASAVVLDPAGWGGTPRPRPAHLDELQRAVVDGVQVRLGYADRERNETVRTVHPLGLVDKGSVWYLVAGTDAGMRTFRVSRVRSVERTTEPRRAPRRLRPRRDVAERGRRRWRSVARASGRSCASTARRRTGCGPVRAQPSRSSASPTTDASRSRSARRAPAMIAERLAGWGATSRWSAPTRCALELARIGSALVRSVRLTRSEERSLGVGARAPLGDGP